LLRRLTRTVAQRIDMPSVGQTTDELVIVEWLKKEGDTVALGESLFSVQTDKAQVEVESVAAGTLLKVLREAGETVQAGSPVAYIGAPGEAVPALDVGVDDVGLSTRHAAAAAPAVSEGAVPPSAVRAEPERRSPERTPGRVSALPGARRLASALGIDLTAVRGTGQEGVITVRDVEQAAKEASAPADDDDRERRRGDVR
jgi:pyruvate dehydrogenase E2 component (dihydrolipoamide acetyltransferase)